MKDVITKVVVAVVLVLAVGLVTRWTVSSHQGVFDAKFPSYTCQGTSPCR